MHGLRRGAILLVLLLTSGIFGCARTPVAPASDGSAAGAAASVTAVVAEASQQSAVLPASKDVLTVLFINVGKADAALLSFRGRHMLIDTGTEESAARLVGALNCMGVKRLDAVFLTHTHSDHIGGLAALAGYIPIDRVYAAKISENKKNGENKITKLAEKCELPLTRLVAGDAVPIADGAVFTVLGPLVENTEDDNDNSLVFKLTCGNRSVLFTGDMQFAEEDTLLKAGVDVHADVLKVGNHGNPDATGDVFADAVSPSIAVISTDTAVDDDSANPRVRAALQGADIHITEHTDIGVSLTLASDGAMQITEPARPDTGLQLAVVSVDKATQRVTIRNDGEAANIGGCMLFSERGGELFRFPAGSTLAAGATATVAAEGRTGDYTFTGESNPWHKKKADTAILYDAFGRELARY